MNAVRVFVVDDHEPFRHAVIAMVEETDGFVVVGSAESGEQCLDLIAATQADLVLMDVNLPVMSGIDAARILTARSPAPVVVLLSTYDELELDYRGSGAVAYLNKAVFSPHRLADLWASRH